ncbi:DUF294 nucleotidyltransferase-like domain-containing protein [Shimia ponticola]|uniref:DUF294 nucleotidyltransferase-like domain-containing protein n=1 Tax=Shimia ponticola TaxID=2582893 RepID=UPI0011BEDAEF|nr:DUF294 nucleotidyltransferase-like domain-containing protein [Shimia ponticola]
MTLPTELTHFLASVHPYDCLPADALSALARSCTATDFDTGATVFAVGDQVAHLYVIVAGEIAVTDESDAPISVLGSRNSFGERALLRREAASRTARATAPTKTILIPAKTFFGLIDAFDTIGRFFDRSGPKRDAANQMATLSVDRVMTADPVTCAPETPIKDVARQMAETRISSVCITNSKTLLGIVTLRDLNAKVLATGRPVDEPIANIMTASPLTVAPHTLVMDVLHLMVERRIGHVPILENDTLVGIVTQTDLTRAQAMSSADIVRRVARANTVSEMAEATAEIPKLLVQLVDGGNRHEIITRLITDIADTATRRLLSLAETELGPSPVPFLWLACGSQGRQEQTGVSDQDNCLMLDDAVTPDQMPYFSDLARFVSDGLHACGYVYCPGDMMATNPRWCQPTTVWREYFQSWIAKPNPEAQMLASVMFDLRPIGGDTTLFEGLQAEVLEAASRNSIFTAHMVANSLKHSPPLGLLRGLATIRSGEHRDALDLKHNGVVPIVDLGRIYALQGKLKPANTRARIEAALAAGAVSSSGGADLLDAYDLIATTRLEHQAGQVRAGSAPSNYLDPSTLSDFERSHLRDAFVVVKTMQSAIGSGKGMLG